MKKNFIQILIIGFLIFFQGRIVNAQEIDTIPNYMGSKVLTYLLSVDNIYADFYKKKFRISKLPKYKVVIVKSEQPAYFNKSPTYELILKWTGRLSGVRYQIYGIGVLYRKSKTMKFFIKQYKGHLPVIKKLTEEEYKGIRYKVINFYIK